MATTRRSVLQSTAMGLTALAVPALASPGSGKVFGGEAFRRAILRAEAESGGRLGVAVIDTADGARVALRGDERGPLCSTFKFLLVAAVLGQVDAGREQLDRTVPITAADLLDNSPVTKAHVGRQGLPVSTLCQAALIWSDNAAANLLLPGVGGPSGLTRYARDLGDPATRLDRGEPAVGEATPGDPRDTTTPKAMAANLERILLGHALAPASRRRLTDWLVDNRTGTHRLRAGLPTGWRIGDKTGSGSHGSANDIAILWPPGRAPLLVATYLTGTTADPGRREAALAAVARAIARAFDA